MRDRVLKILIAAVLIAGPTLPGQEVPPQEAPPATEPVFVRLTLYPTASLSRYDYSNDIDLYEVRAYAEIREGSRAGDPIAEAKVTVLSERLNFETDHFEKRIVVSRDTLPSDIETLIDLPGRPQIKRAFPLPVWLIIEDPKPSVIEAGRDLAVRWRFTAFAAPVNVRAYDFKKGGTIASPDNVAGTELVIPADKLPSSTILRILVITSWISKQYLGGPEFSRGSEINVIPWSQVFVRTQESR